jgi:ATP-binding cassette subfamily B protein
MAWKGYLLHDETALKGRIDRKLVSRVLVYGRSYRASLVLALVTIASISLLELVPPLLFRELIDKVLPAGDFHRLNLIALAMIGIPVLTGLLTMLQRFLTARTGEGLTCDLRRQMFIHVQRMSLGFFTHTRAGEIISRFNNDVVGAQNAITGTLPALMVNVTTLISTFVVMLTIEWRLALAALAVVPLFLLPSSRIGRIMREVRRRGMQYSGAMSSVIAETLSVNGALLSKTFGQQQHDAARFEDISRKVRDNNISRALVGRWLPLALGIAAALGTGLIYWIGGHLTLSGAISVGTIVAFAAYLGRIYGPVSALANMHVDLVSSLLSFERVFEYLDMPVEIVDRPQAREASRVQGAIEFKQVSFQYPLSRNRPQHDRQGAPAKDGTSTQATLQHWALQDVSFKVPAGQLVALVGPSGAGKTSLTYLLPRLYDPTAGAIYLDGVDLRDFTQQSLAQQFGIVTQDTYLFHDTVRANLLYAKPHAGEKEMIAACSAARIHEELLRLPDGYDTMVGERGYRMSGGEKQRLAIARVILKDPAIFILDEATAHLDSHNEHLIQDALEPLLGGRTSFVVAHRLSTILKADLILVFREGLLVEQGKHSDLLERNGVYRHLYDTQFGSVRS